MALLVRYIHGPVTAFREDVNVDRLGSGKFFSIGHRSGSRICLPKGPGVEEESAFIRRVRNDGSIRISLEPRVAGLLLRHPGEQYFSELKPDEPVALEHGQLLKIGPHLFDVVDTDVVKPGSAITHTVFLDSSTEVHEYRGIEGSSFLHHWKPKVYSRYRKKQEHGDLTDPDSWFPPTKLIIHTILGN